MSDSNKIKSFAHGEFNKANISNEENIKLKIEKGQDVFERGHNLKKVESVEIIKQLRVTFAEDNKKFLSNKNLYTLCKTHHLKLHTLYGQNYSNHLVPKVKKWLELQREKVIG